MSYAVRGMASRSVARTVDPTIYPTEERVGEEHLQRLIVELLRPLVERWLAQRGIRAFTGADLFVYYKQFDPLRRVSPDVLVIPGVDPGAAPTSWKVWEEGAIPTFAIEVCARSYLKDYVEAPERYAELGTREVVIFDPHFGRSRERFRFQVYRRLARRGLVRVEATNDDRVRSRELGCFLRAVGEDKARRLRLAIGPRGDELVPTAEEAALASAARERAERERLEHEIARLRAAARKPRRPRT